MTDKQKAALQTVANGEPIAMVHAGALKQMGYVRTTGRARPGYMHCRLTEAGKAQV